MGTGVKCVKMEHLLVRPKHQEDVFLIVDLALKVRIRVCKVNVLKIGR